MKGSLMSVKLAFLTCAVPVAVHVQPPPSPPALRRLLLPLEPRLLPPLGLLGSPPCLLLLLGLQGGG